MHGAHAIHLAGPFALKIRKEKMAHPLLLRDFHSQAQTWPPLGVPTSDAPVWNLTDILITNNGSEISANTDSRSYIQLCSNFLPFST